MLKILHTGDLHIGKNYAKHEPQIAEAYRNARISALENAVKIANVKKCDYMIISGDLYDKKSISAALHKEVCKALSQSACPVIIIPGNHDYCEGKDDELWNDFEKYSSDNTVVLRENKAYETENAVFFSCVCNDRYSEKNALGWLENAPKSAEKFNIGIAHGALEGLSYDKEGKYYGMKTRELEQTQMDLWLLGHTHVPFPLITSNEKITNKRIFNAGTPQQTDISDNSEGTVFYIEIDEKRNIAAECLKTGVIRFAKHNVELRHGENLKKRLEEILGETPEKTSYRVEISGTVCEEDYNSRGEIYRKIAAKTLCFDVRDSKLCREITEQRIDEETPEGSLENQLLKQYINSPEMLNLTFELLKKCKEEK